jgi:leucyl-tRNA synthetase
VPKSADQRAIEAMVKSLDFVNKHISDKPIKKTIVVPGRLVNIVV